MQILGSLIKLPNRPESLPLPWWHRAPLGLQSSTSCFAAIVEEPNRPVGDLIVSVLNPATWHNTLRVQCRNADSPGVVASVLQVVRDHPELNIALAESVTLDAGTAHDVTLICEQINGDLHTETIKTIRDKLIIHGFDRNRVETERFQKRNINWIGVGEVQRGLLTKTRWHTEFVRRYRDNANLVDLSRAVVSADTRSRFIRFVFPYHGAKTVSIEHADRPQTLHKLLAVLSKCELNALSCLLRRGGARPQNAVLVAACEPMSGAPTINVEDRLREEIGKLSPDYRASLSVNDGIDATTTLAPRIPRSVVARMPEDLLHHVHIARNKLPPGSTPVFLSRRFSSNARATLIADAIRNALTAENCAAVESAPEDEAPDPVTVFSEVSAKMWLAEAGIVLVTDLNGSDPLGLNLPHEFGFFQGQGKPILLLVEGYSSDSLRQWSNTHGVFAPRFSSDASALVESSPDSIHSIVTAWLQKLQQHAMGIN